MKERLKTALCVVAFLGIYIAAIAWDMRTVPTTMPDSRWAERYRNTIDESDQYAAEQHIRRQSR